MRGFGFDGTTSGIIVCLRCVKLEHLTSTSPDPSRFVFVVYQPPPSRGVISAAPEQQKQRPMLMCGAIWPSLLGIPVH
jgi:hypothetical protein